MGSIAMGVISMGVMEMAAGGNVRQWWLQMTEVRRLTIDSSPNGAE